MASLPVNISPWTKPEWREERGCPQEKRPCERRVEQSRRGQAGENAEKPRIVTSILQNNSYICT